MGIDYSISASIFIIYAAAVFITAAIATIVAVAISTAVISNCYYYYGAVVSTAVVVE